MRSLVECLPTGGAVWVLLPNHHLNKTVTRTRAGRWCGGEEGGRVIDSGRGSGGDRGDDHRAARGDM
jgi:hypothetical protein